jgi:hypothetical protein
MPRRKQQFSFLKRALRANAGGTSGKTLAAFEKFLKGETTRNKGTIPADVRIKIKYGVYPFASDQKTTADDTEYFSVNISNFSNEWRKGKSISNADLGLEPGSGSHTSSGSFYPALARVSVAGLGAVEEKTSGITLLKYKVKAGGASYSIPFGAVITKNEANSYKEQMGLLTTKLKAAGATSVGFEPERWNKERAEGTLGT